MNKKIYFNYQYLLNPVFLVCLTLLLLNDLWFKTLFDNWFTGKLSDFAGIVVFVLFFSVFFKSKKVVFITSAILFTLWKSELSLPFIDFWNQLTLFNISRVVDYSDLFCLLVLIPLFYYYPITISFSSNFIKKSIAYPLVILTIFSITATSRMRGVLMPSIIHIDKTVKTKLDKSIFFEKLTENDVSHILDTVIKSNKQTIEKYTLENIIIAYDTFSETYIGIEEKRRKLIINIEWAKMKENPSFARFTSFKNFDALSKDYGNKIADYINELDK